MDPQFWLSRWQEGQTGFHRDGVSPELAHFGPGWVEAQHRVLVPLCGKSHDLLWLASQGAEVVGVELSPLAAQAFFAEHGLTPERDNLGPFSVWRAGRLSIWVGDFFALDPARDGQFDRVWDRAALVAMDAPRRPLYVKTLRACLAPGGSVLLSSFHLEGPEYQGPPHSVPEDELRALYAGAMLEHLQDREGPLEPRFVSRGVTRMVEQVWRIEGAAQTVS